MDLIEMILKYGLGAVALVQLSKLRTDMRAGFDKVTVALEQQDDRIDDHETRLRLLESSGTVGPVYMVVTNDDDN